jgi:Flp pilus assembly protein TadG
VRSRPSFRSFLPRPFGRVAPGPDARRRQRGQVLPLFAVMTVVLLGGAALLTDVAWWWVNEQRMQRAADAGALAGAIHLPGNETLAFSKAHAEVHKNGYTDGVSGMAVTPKRDPGDPRKLIVEIGGPVSTHFAKVLSLDSVGVGVSGAASYVLPVPMGSPQNYYGVGFLKDVVTSTNTTNRTDDTNWDSPTALVSGGQWSDPNNAYTNGYTTETTDNQKQDWREFNLLSGVPNDPSLTIDGIEVRLRFAAITGSGASADCRVGARVSWDGGTSWSDPVAAGPLSTTNRDYFLGSTSNSAAWGSHVWTRADLLNSNFRVRLGWNDGTADCGASRGVRVGEIEARATYSWADTQTTTSVQEVPVRDPNGAVLAPHGFWGALQSQGAPNIQGDAYMTYYDTRTSRSNGDYAPDSYYQYEIAFPSGYLQGRLSAQAFTKQL